MANSEHRSLTGASLHELKGVSSAADNKVATALSGATNWKKLTHTSLETTGNPFGAQLLHIRDNATLGSHGGALTAATWVTRNLDTVETNEITGASLSANLITLPAGTYYFKMLAPATNVGYHKIRLQNTTDSTPLATSPASYSLSTPDLNWVEHEGRFTIAATKKIRLEHICTVTNSTTGAGIASNIGSSETYAQVYFWKVA